MNITAFATLRRRLNFLRAEITQAFSFKPMRLLARNIEHVHGCKEVVLSPQDVIVISLVRNGEPYIKAFMDHYFDLGAHHILLLDNGSTDRTLEIARQYKRVTILKTDLSFKKYNMLMREYLVRRFANNRWSLCVDIDEFFDYPNSETLNIKGLIEYLNQHNYTAVACQMLDMFPKKLLRNQKAVLHRNNHRYYDVNNIVTIPYVARKFRKNYLNNRKIMFHFGGIRKKMFGFQGPYDLFLTKHSLLLLNHKTRRHPYGHEVMNAHVADFSAVLFHYKFLDDFWQRTENAITMEQYSRNSFEYKKYQLVLNKKHCIDFTSENMQEFTDLQQLLDNNFLIVSEQYRSWIKTYCNQCRNT